MARAATEDDVERAWQDTKLAQVLYHDWEADSYDAKWSISFDQRCVDYARDRFVAIAGTAGLAMEMVRLFQVELEHYEKIEGKRLSLEGKAAFLARHWAKQLDSGEVMLASDPRHKIVNPYLFRIDEALACWRRITAPVLLVSGKHSNIPRRMKHTPEQLAERKNAFRNHREVELDDCGHMMHHDQPGRLAEVLEEFFTAP